MSFVGLPLVAVIAAAVLTVVAVVALYLLKSTPRPQPVSNVDFWARAVEEAKPVWVFSTRVPLVALLLTLLVALLLVLLAGDPRLHDEVSSTTVVVLDAGRTMEVEQEGRQRFDLALERAEAEVARATRAGRVAVVRAGVRPSVLVPLTRDSGALARALEGHQLDQGRCDLDAAVALADRIVARRPSGDDGRVVVISDRHPTTTTLSAPLRVISDIGDEGQTVAITAFGARRDPTAMGEYAVYCEVRAFSRGPATATLVIRDLDVTLAEEELELQPGEQVSSRARGFARESSEITATLEEIEIEGAVDALTSDDRAFAAIDPLSRLRVLAVTGGNRYLEGALRLDPAVELEQMTPAELVADPGAAASGGFDVVVLDGSLDEAALRHPGLLLIAPPERRPQLRIGTSLSGAVVTEAQSSHPVLEAVDLTGLRLRQARTLLPEPEDQPLFRADRHVLATARDLGGQRRVVLGFDPARTALVERPAYPLMIHNAVVWLANAQRVARSSLEPGQPLIFSGRVAEVELPSGEVVEASGGAFRGTSRTGIYHVDDQPRAISSAALAEPLAAPRGSDVEAPELEAEPPLGLILALVMLALIALEWVLLHRGRV